MSSVGFAVWDVAQKAESRPGVFVPTDPVTASPLLDIYQEADLRAAFVADGTIKISGIKYNKTTRKNAPADVARVRKAAKIEGEPDFVRPGMTL
tara:strand:+ start:34 stop:315 length:282 start_codon:yes stop_codon:yes gene_type:complete